MARRIPKINRWFHGKPAEWEVKRLKYVKYLMLFGVLALLGACTASGSGTDEVPEMVEADILVPSEMDEGEKYQLQVQVTQGGEAVEDANEVLFELWNDSEGGDSSRIEAVHVGDGLYEIEQSFEAAGIYSLQTHVTARSMHVMPKLQFQVGDVTEEQVKKAEENVQHQKSSHMKDQDDDGHDH